MATWGVGLLVAAATLGVTAPVSGAAAPAPSTAPVHQILTPPSTPLVGTFGGIAVDDAHQHVFVSSPSSGSIAVFTFAGTAVTTLSEPGAGSMVVDGGRLYVASSTAAEVDVFDTATFAAVGELGGGPSGVLSGSKALVEVGGRLWTFGLDDTLVSIDPVHGTVTPFSMSAIGASTADYNAWLAPVQGDPGSLLVYPQGLSPSQVVRLDVSGSTPAHAATQPFTDGQDNLRDVAAVGDRTVEAAGGGYPAEAESHTSDLTPDGVAYPVPAYPTAVAATPRGAVSWRSGATRTTNLPSSRSSRSATRRTS